MRTFGVGTPPRKTIGMYSACLFCHADLGQNEAIETFPLGRRLAFDAALGRLWVVCAECKGWNLTPLEERWEAVEECERRYQDTRVRVSTGQISLARLRDGLDLIRIGEPARPEFAAWRYGERLALRRRNSLIRTGLGLGVFGAVVAGGAVVGVSAGIAAMWISAAASAMTRGSPHKILAFINWRTRSRLVVRRKHLAEARLLPTGDGYRISVPGHTMELSDEWAADLSGHAAIGAASRLLPEVNRFGGSRQSIAAATSLLACWPEPSALYAMIAAHGEANGGTPFADLPLEQRLALEMAAHEDTERRALEGELDELMSAWRDAEEIARISDAMFQPVEIGDWLARAKAQGT